MLTQERLRGVVGKGSRLRHSAKSRVIADRARNVLVDMVSTRWRPMMRRSIRGYARQSGAPGRARERQGDGSTARPIIRQKRRLFFLSPPITAIVSEKSEMED